MRGAIYDMLRRASSPKMRARIKSSRWFIPVSQRVFGNEVYSQSYYADIERLEGESVGHMAAWIVENMGAGRMIDIGCGPGHLMAALGQRGVEPFGVDIATAALKRVRAKGLVGEFFDLAADGAKLPGIPYDVAISCEVAEHLNAEFADRFVDHLCSAADRVFLTAAVPNKDIGPGLYHVNEQSNGYWVEKMSARGFGLDAALTSSARARFADAGVIDYLAEPMVFGRA